MKQVPKSEIFSLFSILAGLGGMAMQTWLFSTTDHKGLLTHGHPSAILSFLLLAGIVAANVFYLKTTKTGGLYDHLFPKSTVAAVGSFLAAAGFAVAAMTPVATGILGILVKVFGILTVVGLVLGGYNRLQGKRPNCLGYGAVSVFLIFRTLVFCQGWSAEVQIERFFFPLLGSLGLLMAAYYRASLVLNAKDCRHYLFFRQFSLFCCLLSLAGGDRIFYLAGAVWMVTDYCIPDTYGKYAQQGGNTDASA